MKLSKQEKIQKRRESEDSLYEVIDENIVLRRPEMRKQKRLKMSKMDFNFLQYHHIIFKWVTTNYELSLTETSVMLYIHPLSVFTRNEFVECQKELGASNHNFFNKLQKGGWITKWSKSGSKQFYSFTNKANTLIARMHKMFLLQEVIPTSPRRNIAARKTDKNSEILMDLFKKFNQKVSENL